MTVSLQEDELKMVQLNTFWADIWRWPRGPFPFNFCAMHRARLAKPLMGSADAAADHAIEAVSWVELFKVSRPMLWLVTLYAYSAPVQGNVALFHTLQFWLGLFYVCFPANLLVYGMNDYSDVAIDADSDRKENSLFGAKLPSGKLRQLPPILLLLHGVPLVTALACGLLLDGRTLDKTEVMNGRSCKDFCVGICICYILSLTTNVLYNFEPFRWSGKPPLDPVCSVIGYLLVAYLSSMVNDVPLACLEFHIYVGLLLLRTHYWFEFFDFEEDWQKQRATTVHLPWILKKSRMGRTDSYRQIDLADPDSFPEAWRIAKRQGGLVVLFVLTMEILAGLFLFPGKWLLPAFSTMGIFLFLW
eukprot:CAMPEP_0172913662 /NCGR_PEP_ID=MMETSP1075-20121228/190855_1 /TAXON_ID=2916 /ORGANISM="Ceratium fusus, Strain PA161109" /LENGTH=358 /DNA_ID=CAMNT_0013772425 /DNA_START=18 /DNA_END=1091 /DNA_ORIENTATION=+